MNARLLAPIGALILVLALTYRSAALQTAVIVSNADATRTESVSAPPGFPSIARNWVTADYANALRPIPLPQLPPALSTALDQMRARPFVDHANAVRNSDFAYPTLLIGDSLPPEYSAISAVGFGDGSATISWTTDEYAGTGVQYGTQQGTYPSSVEDSLFAISHRVSLTGLTVGQTYHYWIRGADRSGNVGMTGDLSFTVTPTRYVYIPSVRR